MKVTVYITNHNYEQYIDKAIQSVLEQHYSDYELLIIDDGSTDNSRTIIERYRNSSRVSIIYQENKGLNVTSNIALRAAKGEYLIRLDADDYLDPNALLVMTNYLEKHPDIALVFPDYYLVDESGRMLSLERRHNFQNDVTLYDQPAHGAGTLVRKDCLLELGGYWEGFQCQDGYDLWLKIIKQYKVANINLPMFYYRQHSKSLTKDEQFLLETRHRIVERSTDAIEEKKGWKTIVIIPVRGDYRSESIVLKPFADTTLLDIALSEIQKTTQISHTIITTPDENIIKYVQQSYPDVITDNRPEHLAELNTHLEETVDYLLGKYTKLFNTVQLLMILHPEAPFRKTFYLDKAVNTLKLFETDSVIAVRPESDLFYKHLGHGLEALQPKECLRLERESLYRQVGGMSLFHKELFKQQKRIIGGRVGHIILDELAGMVINSELDWQIAEMMYARILEKSTGTSK